MGKSKFIFYLASLFILLTTSFITGILLFILNSQRLPSIYHLYLPTFFHKDSKDSTDKEKKYGRGNLKGVIEKLPYIKSLGVDYLYLSPFFHSLMMDGGYDVVDYQKVNPLLGKRGDLKKIIDEIPVISDFVLNHTSYQHKWFENALLELKDGKEDGKYVPYYYIFKIVDEKYQPSKTPPKVKLLFDVDGKQKGDVIDLPWWNDGGLNELKDHPYTAFSQGDDLAEIAYLSKEREIDGKVQPWIPKDDGKQHSYFLYTFSWFQPDLNWNNPEVRREIKRFIDFWGREGIKGFRFDAVSLIGKSIKKGIAKPLPGKLEKFLTELNLKRYFSIGELSQDGDSNTNELARVAKKLFNTAYLFDSLSDLYYAEELNGFPKSKAWPRGVDNFREEKNFREVTKKHYSFDKLNNSSFHTSLIMENHDHIRSVSRFAGNLGKVKERRGDWRLWIIKEWFEPNSPLNTPNNVMKRAKPLALFEFLQRGIPLIFNGEELGMDNDITTASDKMINGIFSNQRKRFLYSIELQSRQAFLRRPQPNNNESKEILRHNFLNDLGRNSPRTVFQWNSSDNAGFCGDCKMWNGKEEPTLEVQPKQVKPI